MKFNALSQGSQILAYELQVLFKVVGSLNSDSLFFEQHEVRIGGINVTTADNVLPSTASRTSIRPKRNHRRKVGVT